MAVSYPVLLIGQASLDVRDSERDLVSVSGSSGLNLVERRLLDAQGRLFEITSAELTADAKPLWLDMGTSPRPHYVVLRELPRPAWSQIQDLVLEQVRSDRGLWQNNPRAVARVQSLHSVEELMAASREAWNWAR